MTLLRRYEQAIIKREKAKFKYGPYSDPDAQDALERAWEFYHEEHGKLLAYLKGIHITRIR
jgi:hypothetical protein